MIREVADGYFSNSCRSGLRAIQGAVICPLRILRKPVTDNLADSWQPTLQSDRFMLCARDFSSCFGHAYGDRNDYALYEVTGDGVDTVGVFACG